MLGLVGESGCGKTTIGVHHCGSIEPTAGTIRVDGADITRLRAARCGRFAASCTSSSRTRSSSLNPRMSVRDDRRRAAAAAPDRRAAASSTAGSRELLEQVGLQPELAHRYPHELSGGQRQRVGIARALSAEPRAARRRRAGVRPRRVGAGVDPQPPRAACRRPGLLVPVHHPRPGRGRVPLRPRRRDVPRADRRDGPDRASCSRRRATPTPRRCSRRPPWPTRLRSGPPPVVLDGDLPSPVDPPSGCRFHTRCPLEPQSAPRSTEEEPLLREFAPGHLVACHLVARGPPAPAWEPGSGERIAPFGSRRIVSRRRAIRWLGRRAGAFTGRPYLYVYRLRVSLSARGRGQARQRGGQEAASCTSEHWSR